MQNKYYSCSFSSLKEYCGTYNISFSLVKPAVIFFPMIAANQ